MDDEMISEESQKPYNGGEVEKTYKLRHNKTDVELTLDELLKNAEKGLDYDRIRPSHELVKKLAQRDGYGDVSHFIAKMNETKSLKEDKAKSEKLTETPQNSLNKINSLNKEMKVKEENKEETQVKAEVLKTDQVKKLEDEILKRDEKCKSLEAQINTMNVNSINSLSSIGSINGAETDERAFYTSKEWDALESKKKQKLIKSGKIFEFMRKWSVK